MSATVVIPKVGACSDHVPRWKAFLAGGSYEEAILPYEVLDATYDKYSVLETARTFDRVKSDGSRHRRSRHDSTPESLETLGRFRLIKTAEQRAFCVFDFIHRDSKRD
jgi:hypothetical protein